ncbi:MAG: hypothetical protein WA093_03730 [Minisyncoccales bacterium]
MTKNKISAFIIVVSPWVRGKEIVMDSFEKELNTLYEGGKNEEILARIAKRYFSLAEMPIPILVIKGWANFRRKEYAEAELAFTTAVERENSPKGWEGLAQIAAYVDKDDATITLVAGKVPNSSIDLRIIT